MKKYYFTAKLSLLIISLLSICFKVESSQASTLLLTSEVSQELIPVNIELSNRIKFYPDHPLEEIIKSKSWENNFLMVLAPNQNHYNRETSIKLMASPIASVAPVTHLVSNQLLIEIGNSLNKLSWNSDRNLNHNTSETSTISILPQADDGNIYRNIYDFEITLTDSTDSNSSETQALKSTQSDINQSSLKTPNNLSYSPRRVSSQTVSITNTINNLDNSIVELTQNTITTGQNFKLDTTPDISQYLININSPIKNSFSVPKTQEQKELEKKLEQQRRELQRQQQQLSKMLEQQRQAKKRKSQQEARNLERKRQQELRQAQQRQARRQQQIQQSLSR